MKFKICSLLILMVLITGCGKQDGVDTNVKVDTGVDVKTDVDVTTNVDVTTGVDVAEQENGDQEEPYYLTFEAATLDGDTITSECFAQSKLTMINIWGTYCGPCIEEMPDLGEIATEYDQAEFQILGLVSDVDDAASEEAKEEAKELVETTGANYPHLLLNEDLYYELLSGVSAVPTTVFFNREGEALGYLVGARSKDAWKEVINELLAEMQ